MTRPTGTPPSAAPTTASRRWRLGTGACGLLALADTLPAAEQPLYRTAAGKVLQAIEARWANWDPEVDGILYGGSMMVHNDRLAGQAFIYNDYFFLEAVLRLLGRYFPVWTFGGPAPAAQTPAPVQEPPRYSFARLHRGRQGAVPGLRLP